MLLWPNSSHEAILDSLQKASALCRVGSDKDGKDISIFYTIYGSGPQKIIFIMGLNGTSSLWFFQVAYFAVKPEYQVCVFDNRGNGLSSAPPGPYT